MRGQWGLLFAFIFALVVAIFAVINVESVTVDYLFGEAQWPLVLVILASALLGALIVGGFGIFRVFRMRRQNRSLQKENQQLQEELERLRPENEDLAEQEEVSTPEPEEKAQTSEHVSESELSDNQKENPKP
ncbi:MAG TPA: lipopolysaccharide assembly protein LapA domain-containing protein [Bacillales bacterium]|nr:lipopolysaccharide assembly protein LapA domain-containing protein [Bacillales bacterium]